MIRGPGRSGGGPHGTAGSRASHKGTASTTGHWPGGRAGHATQPRPEPPPLRIVRYVTEKTAGTRPTAGAGGQTAGAGAAAEFERVYRANVDAVSAYFARRTADPQLVADSLRTRSSQ
jgi:hypothetical protein